MPIAFRPLLLLLAIIGVFGQSTAIAMGSGQGATMSSSAMAAMEFIDDMTMEPMSGSMPCKKPSLQCIAVMGCPLAAWVEPMNAILLSSELERLDPSWPSVAHFAGRTFGPEPDPPDCFG